MIAPDMNQMLAQVDQFELDALKMVDSYIARIGLNAPAEVVPQLRNGYEQGELDTLNLEAVGIKTVIWATGYKFDFSFVKLPATDEDGLSGSNGRHHRILGPLFPGNSLAAQP
jgi:putative flavoprotein involved in K+ transport